MPEPFVLSVFSLIVLLAVYAQTVTGFGLAMIVMGLASGLNIASVAALASVISIVTVVNSLIALRGRFRQTGGRVVLSMVVGVLPASVLGVLILNYLSASATTILQVLLGLVIVAGGVSFAWRPAVLKHVSSGYSFAAYGFMGGLIGGMFGIPGPPLIFQFYRQPMSLGEIRNALIMINLVIATTRTGFVYAQGDISPDILLLSGICLPLVALATVLGRRYPPPLAPEAMRRLAFGMLVLMGGSLIISALTPFI